MLYFYAVHHHLWNKLKNTQHKKICLLSFFLSKEDIEYFTLTSTNLSIYTATEAIEPHCNFRGTKTGNFLKYSRLHICHFWKCSFTCLAFIEYCDSGLYKQGVRYMWLSRARGGPATEWRTFIKLKTGGEREIEREVDREREREKETEQERKHQHTVYVDHTETKNTKKTSVRLSDGALYHSHLVSSPVTNSLKMFVLDSITISLYIYFNIFIFTSVVFYISYHKNTTLKTNV